MKIRLELEIDVPFLEGISDDEISQNVFDDIINFCTCQHLDRAMNAIVEKSKAEKVNEEQMAMNWSAIIDHHNLWADIMREANGKIVVL